MAYRTAVLAIASLALACSEDPVELAPEPRTPEPIAPRAELSPIAVEPERAPHSPAAPAPERIFEPPRADLPPLPTTELDALLHEHAHEIEGESELAAHIETRYARISADEVVGVVISGLRDADDMGYIAQCSDGTLAEHEERLVLLRLEAERWSIARELVLESHDGAAESTCGVASELEIGDWNRDGVADARVALAYDEVDFYRGFMRRRVWIVELGDPLAIVFDDDAGIATSVSTPGCYEGDDEETDFSVSRNDRVSYAWIDRGAREPFDMKRTLESDLRRCTEEIDPIHRRGEGGTCIQEQTFGWSAIRRRWIVYRGFTPRAYALVLATGRNEDHLRSRSYALPAVSVHLSDDVPGLRPGRFVALAGACEDRARLDALRDSLPLQERRSSYVRPLSAMPGTTACP
jgi:hypothetical protein